MYMLAAAVLASFGAWWFISGSPQDDALLTTAGAPSASPVDKELVGTLLQLRKVELSGTIFSDPAFQRLQDFGTQIVPESVGRPNPFIPPQRRSTSTASGGQLFQGR